MQKVGIVAFAFGTPATINSNTTLARISAKWASNWNCPVFTQVDIQRPAEFMDNASVEFCYVQEEVGNPPPTLRIAREAVKWAKERGITMLWIVAAGPHLWRCERDLAYAIREAWVSISIRTISDLDNYVLDYWFCQESTQPRTQSSKAWNGRERILRLMPMWLYKRVAS